MGVSKTDNHQEVESINHQLINKMSFFINDLEYRGLHAHKDIEVLLVLSGSLEIETPEEQFILGEGSIAYFNPTQPHSCKSVPMGVSRILVLQFDPSFCVEYFPAMRNLFISTSDVRKHFPEEEYQKLTTICLRAATNYYIQSTGFVFKCISDLNLIMDLMLNNVPYIMIPEEAYLSAKNFEKRMSRIISYIRDHFSEKITLQDIADMEGLTPTYLSHLFKDHLHKSFQLFVNELRLERAVFLLINTNMKVIDVCIESGFSDSKYLNRTFIKTFGMTPKEFRKEHQTLEHAKETLDKTKGEFVYDDATCLELLSKKQ